MASEFKTRCACGTIHCESYEAAAIIEAMRSWGVISYAVFGEETCPNTFAFHLQYYVEFTYSMPCKTFQNRADKKCFYEARKASPKRASDYCKKGEQPKSEWNELHENGPNFGLRAVFHEWGTMSAQGKPSAITRFCECLADGERMADVARRDPDTFIRFHKGIKEWNTLCNLEPRDGETKPNVTVFHGSAGSGKSKEVNTHYKGHDVYKWTPNNGNWFDGYHGQKTVIFEEFRGQIPFAQFLALLDRYDCKVQGKGTMCEFCATEICIISPVHPDLWYQNLAEQRDIHEEGGAKNLRLQLLRRIDRINDMDDQLHPGLRAERMYWQ